MDRGCGSKLDPMAERDARLPVGKLPAELLGRLIASYGSIDPTVVVGPGVGGDAAAIDLGATTLVVKSDPITFASESPAQYLVDVNANDLACLGAKPRWMMVTALLPPGTTEGEVEAHFRELRDACVDRGVSLVGGHTEVTTAVSRTILIGVLLGEARGGALLRPGGARPGDVLLLTKAIAIEGTALLARELADRMRGVLDPAVVERAASLLTERHLRRPGGDGRPRRRRGIRACADPTEGLATGVRGRAGRRLRRDVEREAVPVPAGDRGDCGRAGSRSAGDARLRQPSHRGRPRRSRPTDLPPGTESVSG